MSIDYRIPRPQMASTVSIHHTRPTIRTICRGLLLLALICLIHPVAARSPHPPPVRRLHNPKASLSILPRSSSNTLLRPRSYSPSPPNHDLRHTDTIHLTLTLPDSSSPAHLLLRPTEDLFHPDAYIHTEGSSSGEKLRAEDFRLYQGEVIDERWINRLKAEEIAGIRDDSGYWGLGIGKNGLKGVASVMIHHPGGNGKEPVLEGSFDVDGLGYHIKKTENYLRLRKPGDFLINQEEYGGMVIFRDMDMFHDDDEEEKLSEGIEAHGNSCSHDDLSWNHDLSNQIWQNKQLEMFTPLNEGFSAFEHLNHISRRSDTGGGGITPSTNFINSINSTSGCPSTQQIVYMGVAMDCNYVRTYNNGNDARTQVLTNWNRVSQLYRQTFNISLGIVELVVQNATCPSNTPSDATWNVGCGAQISLDERLSRFSSWRGNRGSDGVGLWHLMSACADDQEVGVAWLGTVCQTSSQQQSNSVVSGTGLSTALQTEWSLVAHEIGHGFGAIHDCYNGCSLSSNCCPYSSSSCNANGRFIMNPTTSSVESSFSGCTLGNICSNIGTRAISTSCFQTPGGRQTISLAQCGNGIVDTGEDCDPGFNSTSTCCDPQTCKFRSGAVCDPTNSACCTSSCSFANNGTLCRGAVDDRCDFPEYCTGSASTCPTDNYRSDGTSCGNSSTNGLACAAGRCTSLDLQCQTAGKSLGLQNACGQRADTSCVVSCKDPSNSNQCIVMQTPLLDGSPCGYGGSCYNQTCQAGSWQNQFQAMYTQNLQISIPVTIVVGIIILAILFFIIRSIFRCCTGTPVIGARKQRKSRQRNNNLSNLPPPPMRQSQHGGPVGDQGGLLPPPPIHAQDGFRNSEASMASTTPMMGGNHAGHGAGGGHNWAYSTNDSFANQQQQPSGYMSRSGPTGGWVDERSYNGPNYGYR